MEHELPDLIEKCRHAREHAAFATTPGTRDEILKFIIMLDALGVIKFARHPPPIDPK